MPTPTTTGTCRRRTARVAVFGAFALQLALCPLLPAAEPPEVLPWNRHGVWEIQDTTLTGDLPSTLSQGVLTFAHDPEAPKLVTGGFGLEVAGQAFELLVLGKTSGSGGLRLSAMLFLDADPDPDVTVWLRTGRLKIAMQPNLRAFKGTIEITDVLDGTTVGKGDITGTYDRSLFEPSDGPDMSNLELQAAFGSTKDLKPGKKASLVVFLVNHGPHAFPSEIQDLRVQFDPVPVEITKVKATTGAKLFEYDGTLPTQSPLRTNLAVLDLLVVAIQFVVPESMAGHDLMATVDLPSASVVGPPEVPRTVQVTKHVTGLTIAFKLENLDEANPIHIFLDGTPDPFSEDTRVPAGGSAQLKLLDLQLNQSLTFKAGRNGSVLAQCSGTVLRPGRANIVYDPSMPPFLALCCGC